MAHPDKDIRKAIEFAVENGWSYEEGARATRKESCDAQATLLSAAILFTAPHEIQAMSPNQYGGT